MDERILLEAVVRAGELMLVSGAEVYRVEDTMKHMLARSGYQSTETIVLATGIFVSLDDPDREPLTLAKRISQRSCNINRIYRVNDVSRRFCGGCISAKEALKELDAISREVQYGPWMKAFGFIGVSVFFTPVFGGGFYDFFGAIIVGVCLALADRLIKYIRLNDFCINAFCAFVVSLTASLLEGAAPEYLNAEVMTISAIMTLVPGVTFTTAIRDTLNGDYGAGSARMLEAIVVALAVSAGVGCGLLLYRAI